MGTLPDRDERRVTVKLLDRVSRTAVHAAWLSHATDTLNRLLALEQAWDGQRARPVTPAAVTGMIAILAVVMDDDLASPQIFPLPDGGLQAEWHAGGHDVEIEIEGDGAVYVIATTPDRHQLAHEPVSVLRINTSTPAVDPSSEPTVTALKKALHQLTQAIVDAQFAR
ncbi:MAG TPA: hypothetical protein VGD55_14930 [Acidothermaceae bacterium]